MLAAGNVAELDRRLRTPIQFGTAGLRAKLEAGFSRMNELTVLQASQGLAVYVSEAVPDALARGIVIGHDHRHESDAFARLTACAFITRGFTVYFLDELVHTPLVPFAVVRLNAACGVMVTASHNPASANGYKVYWANGCQIVSPHDKGIAAQIENNYKPWVWDKTLVDHSGLVHRPLKEVADKYYAQLKTLAGSTRINPLMRFMYTPMHGVGLPYAYRAASLLGARPDVNMFVVSSQATPDPDFPTVDFPNPEEKGALKLVIAAAQELGISLVMANDPDADRFSAAVMGADGKWMQLTGNELGILFAYFLFHTIVRPLPPAERAKVAMLNSTASSQILRSLAETEGFYYEETLTGFKWLGNRAIELEAQGYNVIFAFEEAIGYMFPGIHDKDGIGAMLMFLKLLRWIEDTVSGTEMTRAQGIIIVLEQIYSKYGYFEDKNSYYVALDPRVTASIFRYIRTMNSSSPSSSDADSSEHLESTSLSVYKYPVSVGARKVTYWRDLTVGYDSSTLDHQPVLPVSKSSEMITFALDSTIRVTIRGSGTEPKLKVYIEAKSTVSREASRQIAEEVWDDLAKEWFRPSQTGLLSA